MASAPNSEAEFGASVKVIPPYGSNAGSAQQTGRCRHRPLRGEEQAASTTPASGAQRSVCAAVAREWAGNAAEITPKVSSNAGQSLSHGLWPCQLPLYKGVFGDGDTGCRVGPAGLLAMTTVFCHSEERSDVGIRPFLRWTGVRAAEVVGPYGRSTEVPATGRCGHRPLRRKPNQPPKPAGAQRSVRARVGEGWAGIGAKAIPKGDRPATARQRLAKRKARKESLVKFGLCPIPSECSTAYKVRKSQQGPARAPVGAASTEQNSLEPRPAARQGASRARNCAAIGVFSFDGSTAVFFLPPQKENGGWKAAKLPWHPPVGRPAHGVARRCRGLDGAGERWYNKLF